MSSNTQIHVSARERFTLDKALGPGGAAILCGVLQRLGAGQFPPSICEQIAWKPVAGSERRFHRRIGNYDVVLALEDAVPRLTVSGMTERGQVVPEFVMQSAHAAVNQALALAVSDRIAQRLQVFAEERMSAITREKVSQTVALKALQLQNARLAIRASCGILVRS